MSVRERAIEAGMEAMIRRRGVDDIDRTDGLLAVFRMDATAAFDAFLGAIGADMAAQGELWTAATSAMHADANALGRVGWDADVERGVSAMLGALKEGE